jgi:hypothetical protein
MDTRFPLSEKLWSRECGSDSAVFKIAEYKKEDDVFPVLYILNEYWKAVNEEDLFDWVDVEVKGVKVRIQKIELQLYRYMNEGCRIFTLMTEAGVMLGVIVGMISFKGIICVRGMYVIPEARRLSLVPSLIGSFGEVGTIIYQTRKENPPSLLIDALKFAPLKLLEDDKLITWSVKWENNYEHI